ncbi:hypothetical protein KY329_03220 [Candidatus Woesearchaeota archaeon]|nr:hypothetical protein [Candidatus Woesearchaeota archaeon]
MTDKPAEIKALDVSFLTQDETLLDLDCQMRDRKMEQLLEGDLCYALTSDRVKDRFLHECFKPAHMSLIADHLEECESCASEYQQYAAACRRD